MNKDLLFNKMLPHVLVVLTFLFLFTLYSTPAVGGRVDETLQTSHVVQSIFSVQLLMLFPREVCSTKIVGDVASP